jgi:hypothetical protein
VAFLDVVTSEYTESKPVLSMDAAFPSGLLARDRPIMTSIVVGMVRVRSEYISFFTYIVIACFVLLQNTPRSLAI